MNTAFYQDKDFGYPEIATVLEKTYSRSNIKVYIGAITPELSNSSVVKTTKSKESTSHIINYSAKHGVGAITECNYITVDVPKYVYNEVSSSDLSGTYIPKGSKLLVVFVGGEINMPRVIGVV